MLTFTDFRQQAEAAPISDETITESRSLIRKGAAVAFTLQSRKHSNTAQASFKRSLTALQSAKNKSPNERIDALCEALEGTLIGLEELTKQLHQATAVTASSALMNERTDKEILRLLKSSRAERIRKCR